MPRTNEDAARPATPTRCVVVLGAQSLQNNLLANLIEGRVGCLCLVRSADSLSGFPIAAQALALLDVESVGADEITSHLQSLSASAACRSIAVINADQDLALDQVVAWPWIMGVFFRDTSQEHLLKGIAAILNDEFWLPRKMLSTYLERTRTRRRLPVPEASTLTRKEIETLRLLTVGNSNNDIAHQLNVSLHTVKTHIYNVFRKIKVNNRVQAVHWALQNIDGADRELR